MFVLVSLGSLLGLRGNVGLQHLFGPIVLVVCLTGVRAVLVAVVLVLLGEPVVSLFPLLWLGVKTFVFLGVVILTTAAILMGLIWLVDTAVRRLPIWESRKVVGWG